MVRIARRTYYLRWAGANTTGAFVFSIFEAFLSVFFAIVIASCNFALAGLLR